MLTASRPRLKDRELVFDVSKSVRFYDENGYLHVTLTNISKAQVCQYYGNELPDPGLEPDRIYFVLRPPEELERAAETSNLVPLLSVHIAVDPEDPPKQETVGALGTDGRFEAPYMKNSLVVWPSEDQRAIENKTKFQLSAGYTFTLEKQSGVYEGVAFDLIMRDIKYNHVALVDEGRCGPDVMVADQLPKEGTVKKQKLHRKAFQVADALRGFLLPRVAKDKAPKLNELLGLCKNVTTDRFPKQKAALAGAVTQTFKPRLVADATLEDITDLLDKLEEEGEGDGEYEMEDKPPVPPVTDEDPMAALMALLKGKLSPEELEQCAALLQKLMPTPDKKPVPPAQAGKPPIPGADEGEEEMVDKKTMDAQLKLAKDEALKLATDHASAMREAEHAVEPFVGRIVKLPKTPEELYKLALDAKKIPTEGVDPAAFKHMVGMLSTETRQTVHDEAPDTKSLQAKIPNVYNLKRA